MKPIKPNKARIRKWVAALRSGKYQQTFGQLQKGDAYCCLGVAQELFKGSPLSPSEKTFGNMTPSCAEYYGFNENEKFKSLKYRGKFPIISTDPLLLTKKNGRWTYASALNDTYRWNFKRIANAIERTYLK